MATKYENYTDASSALGFQSAIWCAQTFTPSIAHTVKYLNLKLNKYTSGSLGTITVSIRVTSGGKPSGGDLVSGTTNGDTLPVFTDGWEWRGISLGDGVALNASTVYAIVVRAPTAVDPQSLRWATNYVGGYTGGQSCYSINSGSSWTAQSTYDSAFEEWDDTPSVPDIPTNISPVDGAIGQLRGVTLEASAYIGDGSHSASQWQISATSGDYTNPVYDSGEDSSNLESVTLPESTDPTEGYLNSLTEYFWHVRYKNAAGWSGYSAETSFTTASLGPNKPINLLPLDEAVNTLVAPELVCSAFDDPDESNFQVASQWQVSWVEDNWIQPPPYDAEHGLVYNPGTDGVNFLSLILSVYNWDSISPRGLLPNTKYYWKVRHENQHDQHSPYSDPFEFTTGEVILPTTITEIGNIALSRRNRTVKLSQRELIFKLSQRTITTKEAKT